MHFLSGGRTYIEPDIRCKGIEEQFHDCLLQLNQFPSEKKIYKLNFFVDLSASHYCRFKEYVEIHVAAKLPAHVISNLITQPPVTRHILAEVFFYDETLWSQKFYFHENGSAVAFEREGARVLVGQVQGNKDTGCKNNASEAFHSMDNLFAKAGFPLDALVRQWNYIEDIVGFDGNKQRYQEFNNVRSEFYDGHFYEHGFPAATGIGIKHGGVFIEFVAVNAAELVSIPVDNPEQIAAHHYSPAVLAGDNLLLKSTPKFERARYLNLFGQKQLFISGTASIRGEKTIGAGNLEMQTRVTIENIKRLYSKEMIQRITGTSLQPAYGHARVYIKNRKDFPVVKRTIESIYENLPVVYLLADICRDDLLVEIEGKVILE